MRDQERGLDFNNQDFYLGIDVHKRSWAVTIRSNNIVLKTFSMNPIPEELFDFMKKRYPNGTYNRHNLPPLGYSPQLHSLNVIKAKMLLLILGDYLKNMKLFNL